MTRHTLCPNVMRMAGVIDVRADAVPMPQGPAGTGMWALSGSTLTARAGALNNGTSLCAYPASRRSAR